MTEQYLINVELNLETLENAEGDFFTELTRDAYILYVHPLDTDTLLVKEDKNGEKLEIAKEFTTAQVEEILIAKLNQDQSRNNRQDKFIYFNSHLNACKSQEEYVSRIRAKEFSNRGRTTLILNEKQIGMLEKKMGNMSEIDTVTFKLEHELSPYNQSYSASRGTEKKKKEEPTCSKINLFKDEIGKIVSTHNSTVNHTGKPNNFIMYGRNRMNTSVIMTAEEYYNKHPNLMISRSYSETKERNIGKDPEAHKKEGSLLVISESQKQVIDRFIKDPNKTTTTLTLPVDGKPNRFEDIEISRDKAIEIKELLNSKSEEDVVTINPNTLELNLVENTKANSLSNPDTNKKEKQADLLIITDELAIKLMYMSNYKTPPPVTEKLLRYKFRNNPHHEDAYATIKIDKNISDKFSSLFQSNEGKKIILIDKNTLELSLAENIKITTSPQYKLEMIYEGDEVDSDSKTGEEGYLLLINDVQKNIIDNFVRNREEDVAFLILPVDEKPEIYKDVQIDKDKALEIQELFNSKNKEERIVLNPDNSELSLVGNKRSPNNVMFVRDSENSYNSLLLKIADNVHNNEHVDDIYLPAIKTTPTGDKLEGTIKLKPGEQFDVIFEQKKLRYFEGIGDRYFIESDKKEKTNSRGDDSSQSSWSSRTSSSDRSTGRGG